MTNIKERALIRFGITAVLLASLILSSCGAILTDDSKGYSSLSCAILGYVTVAPRTEPDGMLPTLTFERIDKNCYPVKAYVEHNAIVMDIPTTTIMVIVPSRTKPGRHPFIYLWHGNTAILGSAILPIAVLPRQKA